MQGNNILVLFVWSSSFVFYVPCIYICVFCLSFLIKNSLLPSLFYFLWPSWPFTRFTFPTLIFHLMSHFLVTIVPTSCSNRVQAVQHTSASNPCHWKISFIPTSAARVFSMIPISLATASVFLWHRNFFFFCQPKSMVMLHIHWTHQCRVNLPFFFALKSEPHQHILLWQWVLVQLPCKCDYPVHSLDKKTSHPDKALQSPRRMMTVNSPWPSA